MSSKKPSSDLSTLELELGIGLAHSWASMLFLTPHLGIGIMYWIGQMFIEHICVSKNLLLI